MARVIASASHLLAVAAVDAVTAAAVVAGADGGGRQGACNPVGDELTANRLEQFHRPGADELEDAAVPAVFHELWIHVELEVLPRIALLIQIIQRSRLAQNLY